MNYLSWNMRGLTYPFYKYMIHTNIDDVILFISNMDFIYLQEVKIFNFLL